MRHHNVLTSKHNTALQPFRSSHAASRVTSSSRSRKSINVLARLTARGKPIESTSITVKKVSGVLCLMCFCLHGLKGETENSAGGCAHKHAHRLLRSLRACCSVKQVLGEGSYGQVFEVRQQQTQLGLCTLCALWRRWLAPRTQTVYCIRQLRQPPAAVETEATRTRSAATLHVSCTHKHRACWTHPVVRSGLCSSESRHGCRCVSSAEQSVLCCVTSSS